MTSKSKKTNSLRNMIIKQKLEQKLRAKALEILTCGRVNISCSFPGQYA